MYMWQSSAGDYACRHVFDTVMGSDGQTFGFGLCLDAWQTLGVLFSYLNSVASALMLAGVLGRIRRSLHQPKFRGKPLEVCRLFFLWSPTPQGAMEKC